MKSGLSTCALALCAWTELGSLSAGVLHGGQTAWWSWPQGHMGAAVRPMPIGGDGSAAVLGLQPLYAMGLLGHLVKTTDLPDSCF